MATKKRNYKKEYADYQGKPEQIKNRAKRNAAAKKADCPKGQDADHKKPIRKGGDNTKSNVRCVAAKTNKGWRKGKKGYD